MRWFKTPEEYLAHYEGFKTEEVPFSQCPRCKSSNIVIMDPTPKQWRKMQKKFPDIFTSTHPTKSWFCDNDHSVCQEGGEVPPPTRVKVPCTEREYVFWVLGNFALRYKERFLMGIMPDGTSLPHYKSQGIIDGLAFMNMFSNNEGIARDGMLISGMRAYNRSQQNQEIDALALAKWEEFKEEGIYAGQLAEDYFSRLENAAAAQEAQQADDERMMRMARQMAKEMFDEAERRRATT